MCDKTVVTLENRLPRTIIFGNDGIFLHSLHLLHLQFMPHFPVAMLICTVISDIASRL